MGDAALEEVALLAGAAGLADLLHAVSPQRVSVRTTAICFMVSQL
jgi:hypothetical protein